MTRYKRTTLSVAIHEEGDSPVYGDSAILVSIDDEAAGPFVVIRSCCERDTGGQVSIDPDMWDHVDAAARELLGQFGEGGE